MRLKVNGQNIDTGKDAVIAVTKTANSLEDAQAFQSSYTNQISIPATRNNALVLGNIGGLDSRGTEYLATAIDIENDSGLPVIIQGLFLVDTHEGKEIKGNIVSGIVDFFEQLGDTKLNEIDLSEYAHVWNLTNVVADATNTQADGYVYALADFGNVGAADIVFDVRQLYPSIYVKPLLSLMVSSLTEYTITDNFYFADAFFEKLALPYSGEQNTYLTGFEFSGQETFLNPLSVQIYTPTYPTQEGSSDFVSGVFTAPSARRVTFLFDTIFTTSGSFTGGSYTVIIRIISNISGVIASDTVSGTSQFIQITLTAQVDYLLTEGEEISTEVEIVRLNMTENQLDCEFRLLPPEIAFGSPLNLESLLPDITCADYIKSIWRLLGIQPQVDNVAKTITFRGFQEYSTTIAGALSLSDKIDTLSDIKIEYVYGSYGKINTLKFKEDSSLADPIFADGTIAISNENLPIDYDMIELDLAPTASMTTANGNLLICDLPILDGAGAITNELEPRICYIDIFTGTREDIDFTDGTTTEANVQYSLTKFVDPDNANNLSFNSNIISERFAQFSLMIQKMQKVTARFKLSDLDFLNLDFFKLVHLAYTSGFVQLNGFYLIQEVKEYKGDDTVELELINVNIE